MGVILFFGLLVVLFFLSRQVTREVSGFLRRVFRHDSVVVWMFSLFFLPGTILHEMAHYVTALLLGVSVGKIEFFPEVRDGGIKLGSVEVGKTDPFRGLIVSTAPIFAGVGVISGLIYFALNYNLEWWMYGLVFYGLFVFGNTMFSSKRDMEGLWVFVSVIVIFGLVIGFLGYFDNIWGYLGEWGIQNVFENAWGYVAVPVGIDLGLLTVLYLIRKK